MLGSDKPVTRRRGKWLGKLPTTEPHSLWHYCWKHRLMARMSDGLHTLPHVDAQDRVQGNNTPAFRGSRHCPAPLAHLPLQPASNE